MSDNLIDRINTASIAACNCGAHTPVVRYHRDLCHYRLLQESAEVIERMKKRTAHYSPSGVYYDD